MNTPVAEPLGYLLHRLSTTLRQQVIATALTPRSLSFAQYLCLRMLDEHPGRSNADLAREVSVSPQAMHVVVRGLQERGLVSRPASAAAGRTLPARLTRSGTALLGALDADVRAAEDQALAPLTDRQRADFRGLLGALTAPR